MRIGVVSYLNPYEFRDYLGISDLPSINIGSSKATNLLVRGFLESGHKVVVFSEANVSQNVHYKKGDLEIYLVSSHHRIPWFGCGSFMMSWKLYEIISKHIEDVDVLHGHWTYQCGYSASFFAKQMPVFCTVRDWHPNIEKYIRGFFNHITWSVCRKYLFHSIMKNEKVHLIANSEYIKNNIKDLFPKRESTLIHNPILIENEVINTTYNGPIFVTVAQNLLDLYKNIDTLVRAFSVVRKDKPEAKLIMVGACDTNHPIYRKWDEERLLTNVVMKGFLKQDELRELLQSTSTMVHPSLEESFGNVIVEGIINGNIVVGGTNSGAVPYLLENGEIGLLTDVLNVDLLAKAMIQSLQPKVREEIIPKSYNHIKNKYDYIEIAQKHVSLFESFMNL